jgi:hypothetical protein
MQREPLTALQGQRHTKVAAQGSLSCDSNDDRIDDVGSCGPSCLTCHSNAARSTLRGNRPTSKAKEHSESQSIPSTDDAERHC